MNQRMMQEFCLGLSELLSDRARLAEAAAEIERLSAAVESATTFRMGDALPCKVVGIIEFQGRLIVALEHGVFIKGDDDIFRKMKFVEIPSP